MSILTREILASAASPHGLTSGTLADPIWLSWSKIHDQAKRMTGGIHVVDAGYTAFKGRMDIKATVAR